MLAARSLQEVSSVSQTNKLMKSASQEKVHAGDSKTPNIADELNQDTRCSPPVLSPASSASCLHSESPSPSPKAAKKKKMKKSAKPSIEKSTSSQHVVESPVSSQESLAKVGATKFHSSSKLSPSKPPRQDKKKVRTGSAEELPNMVKSRDIETKSSDDKKQTKHSSEDDKPGNHGNGNIHLDDVFSTNLECKLGNTSADGSTNGNGEFTHKADNVDKTSGVSQLFNKTGIGMEGEPHIAVVRVGSVSPPVVVTESLLNRGASPVDSKMEHSIEDKYVVRVRVESNGDTRIDTAESSADLMPPSDEDTSKRTQTEDEATATNVVTPKNRDVTHVTTISKSLFVPAHTDAAESIFTCEQKTSRHGDGTLAHNKSSSSISMFLISFCLLIPFIPVHLNTQRL